MLLKIQMSTVPSNLLGEEKENDFVSMQDGKLYLIMNDVNHYVFYCIRDPHEGGDETILCFEEPVYKMDKGTYPDSMNFAAIGSNIYMVGGSSRPDNGNYVDSDKVYIYDTVKSKCVAGPPMNSGKHFPHLITLGSQLFAMSTRLNYRSLRDRGRDRYPRFEVLDTEDLGRGWCSLMLPALDVSREVDGAFAFTAVGTDRSNSYIFASVGNSGTWRFDVHMKEWKHVSEDALPFSGQAMSIPDAPSVCCGYLLRSGEFCGFEFENNQTKVIEIDSSYARSPLPSPLLFGHRTRPAVFGPSGRVYFISSGVDKPATSFSCAGNRYVHIYALEFCNIKSGRVKKRKLVELSEEGELKETKDQKLQVISFKGKGLGLQLCSSKKKANHEEEEQKEETKERKLEDFSFERKRTQLGSNKMGKEEVEVKDLKLRGLWRRSFFGGPACDPYFHVAGAFAM